MENIEIKIKKLLNFPIYYIPVKMTILLQI
jgi:hypothetical protein